MRVLSDGARLTRRDKRRLSRLKNQEFVKIARRVDFTSVMYYLSLYPHSHSMNTENPHLKIIVLYFRSIESNFIEIPSQQQ